METNHKVIGMEELEMKTCMWEVIRKINSVDGLQVPMELGAAPAQSTVSRTVERARTPRLLSPAWRETTAGESPNYCGLRGDREY